MDRLPDSQGMSRREFLIAANAAALLLFLESCSLGPLGRQAASPAIPAGSSTYEQAVKLLREAVRASPDHLAQRASDLLAARDATKIVEFVRDRIAVLPSFLQGDDPAPARKWGSAATLRGGQGTLRDRAELLAGMLNQAGFKAQVQAADRPPGLTVDALYKPRAAAFSPDQSRIDSATRLLRQAGFPAPAAQHPFASGPDPAAAILAALPAALQVARVRTDLLPDKVPVVVFSDAGKQRYALALGSVGIMDSPPARLVNQDAEGIRNITFTVSALCNPALGGTTPRGKIVDLVSASWPAERLHRRGSRRLARKRGRPVGDGGRCGARTGRDRDHPHERHERGGHRSGARSNLSAPRHRSARAGVHSAFGPDRRSNGISDRVDQRRRAP